MAITQNKTLNQTKNEEKIKEIESILKEVEVEYKKYGDNEIVIKGIVIKSILSKYPELVIKRRSTIIKIIILPDVVVIYIEDEEKKVWKQITLPPNTFIDYQYPNLKITF